MRPLVLPLLFPLLSFPTVDPVVTTSLTPCMRKSTLGQPRDGVHASQVKAFVFFHESERKRGTGLPVECRGPAELQTYYLLATWLALIFLKVTCHSC